ncbi:MAG: sugar ABC transporter permease [Defluviitaleaceae bacterium]|nr:sugar ABC transporter permease [Defluviitaleaceae bacterium]
MKKLTIEQRKKLIGSAFVAPWVIGLLLFWVYPMIASSVMSLFQITPYYAGFRWEFIGLANFNRILRIEARFLDQLVPFMFRTIVMAPVIVLFAVVVALLLNQKFPGRGMFRAVFFLPVLFTTGGVIITLMTDGGMDTAETAGAAATTSVSFLNSEALMDLVHRFMPPRIAVALSDVLDSFVLVLWYAGIQITLLIAGCQSIPGTIYEAASIDGANAWETMWKITLPGILPFILISLIYTIVDLSSLIDNPILELINDAMANPLTQGMGLASAIGWVYQVVIMLLIGFVFFMFRKATPKQ